MCTKKWLVSIHVFYLLQIGATYTEIIKCLEIFGFKKSGAPKTGSEMTIVSIWVKKNVYIISDCYYLQYN